MILAKKTLILWFFIALKFGLHCIIIAPEYNLHRDEYLHLDQGKHLAWGYLSVPPFMSWNAYLIMLLGNSEFWVKFLPVLFGVLTLVVVWKATEALGGNLFALILGATAITLSVLLRINMLFQPNSVDILGWTLFYFCVLQYIQTTKDKWLYVAAIVFGIAFLNKYNIVFLVAGLGPALLITRQRQVFANRSLYLAAILAVVIILPNLIWQYQNHFPVVHHMQLLAKTQLVNVNRMDFLKEQVIFFLGSIFIILAAFLSFFIYTPHKKYQVFFWSFLFSLLIFVYLKAKGYYAIGLYPIFMAFGSVYLEMILQKRLFWVRPVAFAVVVGMFIPFFRIGFPTKSPSEIAKNAQAYRDFGLLRWEDGKDHEIPQDFADMLGWKELAEKVDAEYAKIADKKHTLVLCDNYGQAGAINYYSRFKNIGAVTKNADYIDWFQLDEEIKNIVLIQNADDDDKERKRERTLFREVRATGEIENRYARERGTAIYVLLNAKVPINKIVKQEIEENRWD